MTKFSEIPVTRKSQGWRIISFDRYGKGDERTKKEAGVEGEYLAGKEFSTASTEFSTNRWKLWKWGKNGEKVYIKVCQAKKERRF